MKSHTCVLRQVPKSQIGADNPSENPGMCSDERWRKAARSVLGSLEGLNRSQQRAIATAMSSTFTLWQVCTC